MKRVIFCGGRDFTDLGAIRIRMADLIGEYGELLVIEGGALGADRIARATARAARQPVVTVEAPWGHEGRRAGSLRNSWMLLLDPHQVEAFPTKESRGTWDMVRQARHANVEVNVHHPEVLAA